MNQGSWAGAGSRGRGARAKCDWMEWLHWMNWVCCWTSGIQAESSADVVFVKFCSLWVMHHLNIFQRSCFKGSQSGLSLWFHWFRECIRLWAINTPIPRWTLHYGLMSDFLMRSQWLAREEHAQWPWSNRRHKLFSCEVTAGTTAAMCRRYILWFGSLQVVYHEQTNYTLAESMNWSVNVSHPKTPLKMCRCDCGEWGTILLHAGAFYCERHACVLHFLGYQFHFALSQLQMHY